MANVGERVIDGSRAPGGYEQLAVSSTAVPPISFPAATTERPGATGVLISVETAAVRWRDDGVAPTATVGMPIAAGDPPFFYTGDPSKLKFIRQSADAVVNFSYYF